MIIVKLNGGLGNQMFQYAFGRAVSLSLNTELKLDISWFNSILKKDTIRHYELACFGLKTPFSTDEEVKAMKGNAARLPRRIFNLLSKIKLVSKKSYFQEKYYHYDRSVESSSDNTYFEGYWQSYRYFERYADVIKDDFFTHYSLEDKNQKLKEEIQSSNSVSLHVRRGDYVSNQNATSYHGVSPLDYYYNAIETICKKTPNPILYIFSDDISWVRENLMVSLPIVFVENTNADRPFEDIYLMSLCKHNIIANSTFSWWGAYLNSNLKKNIIAPKKWFNNPAINTEDLIPNSWIRM